MPLQARPASGSGFGGAERDRTADLVNAIHALSQLSYGPAEIAQPQKLPKTAWPVRAGNHAAGGIKTPPLMTNDPGGASDIVRGARQGS